ncbi:MAG TPA: response regulator transcription factor [Thiobacillaceae bacterium]|nr:response regulator transcription factor [Thiobacillaceae bacterium]
MSRILLIDDDEDFLRMLSRALVRRGLEVLTAAGPQEARFMLTEDCPDYAVVDLKLGQASGLSLLRELKTCCPSMIVVMLTGYASIATAVEAVKLGAVNYLAKPATVDEIVGTLYKSQDDAASVIEVMDDSKPLSVDRLEWEHIQRVLVEHDGNVSATARALNMHRRTLQRKLGKKPVRQ